MKIILLFIGFISVFEVRAQQTRERLTDRTAIAANKKIRDFHDDMEELNLLHMGTVITVAKLMEKDKERLKTGNTQVDDLRPDVLYFVNRTTRNYFNSKYPIVSPYTAYEMNMFKNISIQLRFNQKLSYELQNIRNYLGERKSGAKDQLYLTEENRLLLTLTALENVINLSIENETY
ncbi:MAG: hypothetical protein AAFZ89_07160 [Bacteroidota bacterium]